MKKLIFSIFVCALITAQLDAKAHVVTKQIIQANKSAFTRYIEKTVVPGVLSIVPSGKDSAFSSFWKKMKQKAATSIAGYSPLQIEGAKSIHAFCKRQNSHHRNKAIRQLGSSEDDIDFINDLLARLDGVRNGDSEAQIAHDATIESLMDAGVSQVTTRTTIKNMIAIAPKITPSVLFPVLARQLFVQFWRDTRGK